jgi:hypothetical protein
MINLELVYAQVEGRPLSQDTYNEILGHVLMNQKMFELKSCEGDYGVLLRNDDGSYHVWFIGKDIRTSLLYVTECGVWPKHRLSDAMGDLMLQMKIDCAGLIERNGEKMQ